MEEYVQMCDLVIYIYSDHNVNQVPKAADGMQKYLLKIVHDDILARLIPQALLNRIYDLWKCAVK